MALRLSIIRDSSWDEAARVRLAADTKSQGQRHSRLPSSSGSDGDASFRHSAAAGASSTSSALHGISARTEWFDEIAHGWAVESVPRSTRFDGGKSSSNIGAASPAAAANSASTPFRSSAAAAAAASSSSGLNQSSTKQQQQARSDLDVGSKYVAVCLGTVFTQELCRNAAGSLPVQALRRMRAGGSSGPSSVLCNVAMLASHSATGQVTMRDLTAQLVPEELMAETARFNGFAVTEPGQPQTPVMSSSSSAMLLQSDAACRTLQLPSLEFKFLRCGAEAYGGSHSGGGDQSFIRGEASQHARLSLAQRPPDAAMLEGVVESLAESESFAGAMGRTTVVFSLFDEHTQAASQIWFVSDTQVPLFGANVAGGLFTPGLWAPASLAQHSSLLLASLSTDNVLFATAATVALAEHQQHFDRVLAVSVAACDALRNAIVSMSTANGGSGGFGANPLQQHSFLWQQEEQGQQLQARRSQLLKMRQQHEAQLSQLQQRIHSSGSVSDRLVAERQYQRLLMGELELLEHRVEEVRQLTMQERGAADEIEGKMRAAQERLRELEEQKKNLLAEHRSLSEETRGSGQVAESLQTQVGLLEQRLAVASGAIVNHRAAAEAKQRQSSESSGRAQRAKDAAAKHELALADAQRHFSQVQQAVADEARESEEAHRGEMRALLAEIQAMQQHNDGVGTKLGELRANLHAVEGLKRGLEREYDEAREQMHNLLQSAPELASAQPGSVLDERRDKLARGVDEAKQTLAQLRQKLDETRHRREAAQEHVLASERLLQRSLATVQLRIPPQLEAQRENVCEEEQHARRAVELETEAGYYAFQNAFYLTLFDRVHRQNAQRHRRRHEELRLEVDVAQEQLRETSDKLKQAEAVADVFLRRMEELAKEQARQRAEHGAAVSQLRQQLLTAESEPVEELVRAESQQLLGKIRQTTAEIELLQSAMVKAPSGGLGLGTSAATRSGLSAAALGGSGGGGVSAAAAAGGFMGISSNLSGSTRSVLAASLAASSTTFAGHRALRGAAPVPAEVRERLRVLRRESTRRLREENAKASELEQRLDGRRRELAEKSSLLSTMRAGISELHEQLQLRTQQMAERQAELELLRGRDEVLVKDLEEELNFAREIGNRHRNENRLQLGRVTQMVSEQEAELARSRHEVAKLEKARNDVVRRMSESNEQTLLMELEHEQRRREELRAQLAEAGVAPSPPRHRYYGDGGDDDLGGGGDDDDGDDGNFFNDGDDAASVYSGVAATRASNYFSSQPRNTYVDPGRSFS